MPHSWVCSLSLDEALDSLIWWVGSWQRGWNWIIFKVPFSPGPFYDLFIKIVLPNVCLLLIIIVLLLDAVRTGFIVFVLIKALGVEKAELFLLSLYVLWTLHRL